MSLRIDTSDYFANSVVIGNTGLGVLAESVPSTGDAGASFIYNDLVFPADVGKEVRGEIISPFLGAGNLFVNEDGSFTFSGAADGRYSFTYKLWKDGIVDGTYQVTLLVGVSAVYNDSNFTYNISNQSSLQSSTTVAYNLLNAFQVDKTLAYNIGGSVFQQTGLNYQIYGNVSSAYTLNYSLLNNITVNNSFSYNVLGNVAHDAVLSYAINAYISATSAISYGVAGGVSNTSPVAYTVNGAITCSYDYTYSILSAIAAVTPLAYSINSYVMSQCSYSYTIDGTSSGIPNKRILHLASGISNSLSFISRIN